MTLLIPQNNVAPSTTMKQKILHTLCYGLSVLLYPLFVPTYLMVAFCVMYTTYMLPLSGTYWTVLLGGTIFFTCLVPLCILGILISMGRIKNMDVSDRKERIIPSICTIISLCLWVWFLFRIHMPQFIGWSGISIVVELLLVLLITWWWKISIHSASMGGALGILTAYMLFFQVNLTWVIAAWLLLSWLLMCARIYLDEHTSEQTVSGFLLGLVCTLVPNLILLL